MKTIVGMFDHLEDAQSAVRGLEQAGIAHQDISVLADQANKHTEQYATGSASAAEGMGEVIATDATAGAAIGGATGLFMALTGLVIPGFGTIVAAGWLVSVLAGAAVGAAAGGLIGGLTGAGIPLEDAIYYKEGLRQGATLVAVRTDDTRASEIAHIMDSRGAVNVDERGEQYQRQGLISPTDSSVLMQPISTPVASSLTAEAPVTSTSTTAEAVSTSPLPTPTNAPLVVEEPMPTGSSSAPIFTTVEEAAARHDTSPT